MNSYDLLTCLPDNVPFTLFSKWLVKNSFRFANIYITIHKKNIDGYNFTEEIKRLLKDLPKIHWIEINPTDGDWRNIATNICLDFSKSEYIIWIEPDFFIKDTNWFFQEYFSKENDIVGWCQGSRFHPSFLCVKRSVIDQTSRDFSPIEEDHFGKFSREIIAICKDFRDINMVPHSDWFHMNGLTQNFTLLELGQVPNHDVPNFIEYCKNSIVFGGSQKYTELVEKALALKPDISNYLQDYL